MGAKMKFLIAMPLMVLGLTGCTNKPTAPKPDLTSEEKELAALVEKIKTETGISDSSPKTIWDTIISKDLFHDGTGRDEIIRYHLKWALQFIVNSETALAAKNTEEAKKQVVLAKDNLAEAVWFLRARKVEYNPEVTRLLKEYWQIKNKLENYDKEHVKPLEEQKYKKAVELEELYFSTGAISISYGRLENTIFYLNKAVETVRMAEIVGDFERFKTWLKGVYPGQQ